MPCTRGCETLGRRALSTSSIEVYSPEFLQQNGDLDTVGCLFISGLDHFKLLEACTYTNGIKLNVGLLRHVDAVLLDVKVY